MGLAREDIDLNKRTITVKRGIVEGVIKSTKNTNSDRTVDLLDQAFEVLQKLMNFTKNRKPITVKVAQRDNRRIKKEFITFIVIDSVTDSNWSHSGRFSEKVMVSMCEAAGVRYRPIGQARHTYGSQLVTAGMPLAWIAKQMGHNSTKML